MYQSRIFQTVDPEEAGENCNRYFENKRRANMSNLANSRSKIMRSTLLKEAYSVNGSK